jgi:hypothetical protein
MVSFQSAPTYQIPIMELMREERGIDPFDDLDDTKIWRENEQPF